MNKKEIITYTIVVSLALCILTSLCILSYNHGVTVGKNYCSSIKVEHLEIVKAGDVWEYTNPDPFKPHQTERYLVLDVKEGYVKYQLLSNKFIDSIPIEQFLKDTKRVS